MSKQHPYPEHIVEAVKMQLSKGYGDLYVCTRDDSAWSYGTMSLDDFHRLDSDEDVLDDLTNDTLGMLWDASRVEIDNIGELPENTAFIDGDGFIASSVSHAESNWMENPVYVIYWGDTDE